MLTIIAAIDRKGAIGYRNKLLFRLPNDMKRFRELTTGHTVIMGRKTFASLPKGALPDRRNIVLSTKRGLLIPGAEVFSTLTEALEHCQADGHVYIIGGATLYREALPVADELYLTEIDAEAPLADVYFPLVDPAVWHEKSRDTYPADERHPCPYSFVHYVRMR